MSEKCCEFIHGMILTNCVLAAVQRGRAVYQTRETKEGKAHLDRRKACFRKSLKEKLKALGTSYRNGAVSEAQHVKNICKLAPQLTKAYGDVLAPGGFPIGRAQKALNLYLKYLWCLGKVSEPPHCPFDSKVIGKLRAQQYRGPPWTKLDTREHYESLVSVAKGAAGRQNPSGSLAQWELSVWSQP